MNDPIPVRFDSIPTGASADEELSVRYAPSSPVRWQSTLAMYAAATGSHGAAASLVRTFGAGADLSLAAGLFVERSDGLFVGHDAATAEVWFDPGDDGHVAHRNAHPLVAFKRSLPVVPLPNEVPYPAWPRVETLGLNCPPLSWCEVPRISFCGVVHRPPERREFIRAFELARHSGLVYLILVARRKFAHANPRTFVETIRKSHMVLCPAGMGRFSYRLYETLAAGRIPVVPSGNHTYAPADLAEHAVICEAQTPEELVEWWQTCVSPSRLPAIAAQNRRVWLESCSPCGWLREAAREIRTRIKPGAVE